MSRGELLGLCGLCGMVLSILCLESMAIPAVIAFGIFSIICFAGHLVADGGFLEATEDTDRIMENREMVWRYWYYGSEVKKNEQAKRADRLSGKSEKSENDPKQSSVHCE